jgi:arylsulfatase A-like enzyme
LLGHTKKTIILLSLFPLILSMGIVPAIPTAHAEEKIPKWIQNTATWWSEGTISDDEFLAAIEFLIKEGVIEIPENLLPPNNTQIESYPPPKPITEQPNIIVIMPDDVGWYNIGAYNDGIMAGITPNIDKIAENGMRFTDYYADPSCTAGRSSFITGELPIRTGLTTVGQAGADIGMPDEAPTIATALKSMGYNTGQFGKNHFGDLNKFLPTVHGFDEFYGYLYHLDALEDPFHPTYPSELNLIIGPRNMIHSFASDVDDNTIEPRWGKVGKQTIEDVGPVPPKRMEDLDDEILEHSINFMQKAVDEDKPFFAWINPSRMHVTTYLSEEYENKITPENGWSIYEAGMVEVDDLVGEVDNFLETNGIKENTIVIFTTDNGAEVFTWPDGGMTPFRGAKGQILEGGMRVPMLVQWPSHIPAGVVENGLMSGLDWMPTLVAAAGNANIAEELLVGKNIGGTTYKVHLDGYDQLDMLTGSGPSNRDVVYYFAQQEFGAVRIGDYKFRFIDQPNGWFGETVSLGWPSITNLRLDPFERAGLPNGGEGSLYYKDFFVFEFWRFVQAQQQIGELIPTFIEYPPMQDPASFNLDSVKKKIEKMRALGD